MESIYYLEVMIIGGDAVNKASKHRRIRCRVISGSRLENLTNKKSIQVVKNESDISNVSISTYEVVSF